MKEKNAYRRVIERTAQRAAMSEVHVALIVEGFWEAVSEQLCDRGIVAIAGFGLFGTPCRVEEKTGEVRGPASVRFVAARALTNEVASCCQPSEKTERKWRRKSLTKKRTDAPVSVSSQKLSPDRLRELRLADARLILKSLPG
ncbi:MAG TPA: hypothetical protein VGP72_00405 [Planctomycetota bacterium]|jgi:nucleoid DNA-binding protein